MNKNLNSKLGIKVGFLFLLIILLQIPIFMVKGVIDEREGYQQQVLKEIAQSTSGEQELVGPFMVLTRVNITTDKDGKEHKSYYENVVTPETFNIETNIDTFEKYRGIYQARLFKAQTSLKGEFDLTGIEAIHNLVKIKLVVGIKDSRGLLNVDKMTINNKGIEVEPGTGINKINQGFHFSFDLDYVKENPVLSYDFNFLLQGMNRLDVLPVGDTSLVNMESTWQHPSFVGKYLPVSSQITEDGFSAKWSTNKFTTNTFASLNSCVANNNCASHYDSSYKHQFVSVNLIEPVDHYLKAERSVDYSLLVITLVFASFFLLELFQARPVHPIQYGFAGLASAIFYLLLVSLSEHIGFNKAYLASSFASVVLLSIYASSMLRSFGHKALFIISLSGLYAMLFGLLQAQNYALLMGTVLCFSILSLIMIVTRNVDWYGSSNKAEKAEKPETIQDLNSKEEQGANHED